MNVSDTTMVLSSEDLEAIISQMAFDVLHPQSVERKIKTTEIILHGTSDYSPLILTRLGQALGSDYTIFFQEAYPFSIKKTQYTLDVSFYIGRFIAKGVVNFY